MSAKTLPVLLLLAACAPAASSAVAEAPQPAAVARPDMRAVCKDKEEWTDPGPPVSIFANVYHVGTCTITVLLVTSPEGHVLLDASPAGSVPGVVANIRALGFDPRDVKWIVSTHEHYDHSGGLAALKRATGALVAANVAGAAALQTGRPSADDPQAPWLPQVEPVTVDRLMRDGEVLAVGRLKLTMHATPAHAPGSTSWSWTSCEGATCHRIAFADSVSTPAPDTYRFSDHPERVAAFREGVAKIGALPCDLLITPHPAQSDLYARYAGEKPLVDPAACRKYAEAGGAAMDARLAKERQ